MGKIQYQWDFAPEHQKLVFKGMLLNRGKHLSDYKDLQNGSSIFLKISKP